MRAYIRHMSNVSALVSTREVAKALGVNPRQVSRLVESGYLAPKMVAPGGPHGAFMFDPADVEALAEKRAKAVAK